MCISNLWEAGSYNINPPLSKLAMCISNLWEAGSYNINPPLKLAMCISNLWEAGSYNINPPLKLAMCISNLWEAAVIEAIFDQYLHYVIFLQECPAISTSSVICHSSRYQLERLVSPSYIVTWMIRLSMKSTPRNAAPYNLSSHNFLSRRSFCP
ncbi:hypothetical protein DdX_14325 [Ditylenchus destructor]|uniref:Uncharacterized protein n=1 Tax=Ditylenchus destructor TaxID=166010 RepID=A0AAD4QVQ6_9BILA|nr:hypothetical protein DdX_14325 [Ditylenchus destructor]